METKRAGGGRKSGKEQLQITRQTHKERESERAESSVRVCDPESSVSCSHDHLRKRVSDKWTNKVMQQIKHHGGCRYRAPLSSQIRAHSPLSPHSLYQTQQLMNVF